MTATISPTGKTAQLLNQAYDHFNATLFAGQLPACLITLQRKAKAYGYFAGERFGVPGETVDEIALNPTHFARGIEGVMGTLVHEMCHLWQHHFGKRPRGCYHNKQWAEKMIAVGLIPSSTGEKGGAQTGQKMTHYIDQSGPFRDAFLDFAEIAEHQLYVELWDESSNREASKKAASKTKYTCPDCGCNAWAKPQTRLRCGECNVELEGPPEADGDGEEASN